MTKNQSLCFLKSKTNRTDYWVFPSNAKRRPIAVETPIYFVLTHFSNYHNSLHVKQTKNRLWIWQDSCERPCLEIPCRDYRQYGDHLLERNIPLIGHYGLYWPLAINYNAKKRHLYFIQTQYLLNWMISLPENCCFSVEIKKIIGYFRFHNNTSASFRDQTVQKIRNFEMSRSLKPINDAPEFVINGIIFKIACNGFIFFAKLFIIV